MAEEKKVISEQEKELAAKAQEEAKEVSDTWAQDIIEDLDDFIESQGIYLRQ